MKIIIGLGNPEKKYIGTRHNVGFAVLDQFQDTFSGNFSDFKEDKKLQAAISEGKINQEKIILVKPLSYYNESGRVTAAVLNYYKDKKESLIVIHDDLALPLGRLKIINDSSAAGNNGIKSIIENLKSQKFCRIKVGIWSELREKMEATDFVIGKFSASEKKIFKEVANRTSQALVDLVEAWPEISKTQNIYN